MKPSARVLANRCQTGHASILENLEAGRPAIAETFQTDSGLLGLRRCWSTLHRWGAIDDAGALTDAGREILAAWRARFPARPAPR